MFAQMTRWTDRPARGDGGRRLFLASDESSFMTAATWSPMAA